MSVKGKRFLGQKTPDSFNFLRPVTRYMERPHAHLWSPVTKHPCLGGNSSMLVIAMGGALRWFCKGR